MLQLGSWPINGAPEEQNTFGEGMSCPIRGKLIAEWG